MTRTAQQQGQTPTVRELADDLKSKGMKFSAPQAIHAEQIETERNSLRAENQRLREALSDAENAMSRYPAASEHSAVMGFALQKARAALKGE